MFNSFQSAKRGFEFNSMKGKWGQKLSLSFSQALGLIPLDIWSLKEFAGNMFWALSFLCWGNIPHQ
jgi:hypothetical protein